MSSTSEHFPTEIAGLPEAHSAELVELGDGDEFDLRIAPVVKELAGAKVRMLAYNGSIPGPVLKVKEGSEIVVNIENQGDHATTVHWHGLRLDNRYDGTHETQPLIEVGESFSVRVHFPDPGVYWYHPHVREDYGQEMGLYGNVLVEPADPDYWPPANRELAMTLDDILLEDGKVAPFRRAETTHSAMGRFGDLMLVGGETDLSLTAQAGEVVRFYFTNTANTRVFNVAMPGAPDEARRRRQRPRRARAVRRRASSSRRRSGSLSMFSSTRPGELTLEHRTPGRTYPLAQISVSEERAEPSLRGRVRDLAHQRGHGRRCASGSRLTSRPSRTRGWPSSPRWTWVSRRGMSSTPVRCIPRSSAPSPITARSAG